MAGDPLLKDKVEKQWYQNHSWEEESCPIELMKIISSLCNNYDDNQYDSNDDNDEEENPDNSSKYNNKTSYNKSDDDSDENEYENPDFNTKDHHKISVIFRFLNNISIRIQHHIIQE